MRSRVWWALPLAYVAIVACSDLDGLTSASPGDAGSDAEDSSVGAPDGASDVAASDGGTDANGPFCASHTDATFCADFDHDGPVQDGFTDVVITGGGSVVRVTDSFVSAPAAMRATTTPFDASPGANAYARVTRVFAAQHTKKIHFEVSLRASAISAESARFLSLQWKPSDGTPSYILLLEVKTGSTSLSEYLPDEAGAGGGTYLTHKFVVRRIVPGEWSHLAIDVSFEDRSLRVTSAGEDVFGEPHTIATIAKGGASRIDVGLTGNYDPNGSSLDVDDVLFVAE